MMQAGCALILLNNVLECYLICISSHYYDYRFTDDNKI